MTGERPDLTLEAFGDLYRRFLESVSSQAPARRSPLRERLIEHFGGPPESLEVLSRTLERYQHPNLQVALDAFVAEPGLEHQLIGVIGPNGADERVRMSDLVRAPAPGLMSDRAAEMSAVEYLYKSVGGGPKLACVRSGLYLVEEAGRPPLAILVSAPVDSPWEKVVLDLMSRDPEYTAQTLDRIEHEMHTRDVYRNRVLAVHLDDDQNLDVVVKHLPPVPREALVLPAEVLERLERQVLRFSRYAPKLLERGHHLRRGVLLYGPPGTGKTLTVTHLVHMMPDRTTILVTGRGVGLFDQACALARRLQPATVVLEDVDLIAEAREYGSDDQCAPMLFELLNEMDGLSADADIIFLLTTNRADVLEPALVERPGRVDLAVRIPLPDRDCRRRLFRLYADDDGARLEKLPSFVAQTEGVSAAFVRELLRRATLIALERGAEHAADEDVQAALSELIDARDALTSLLLGAHQRVEEIDDEIDDL